MVSVAEASLVNKIRERAYGNATHDYAMVDLAKVQLERRLELVLGSAGHVRMISARCI